MLTCRKYVHFALTMAHCELLLEVLKNQPAKLLARIKCTSDKKRVAELKDRYDACERIFNLVIDSAALGRANTKFILTEGQFDLVNKTLNEAKLSIAARMQPQSRDKALRLDTLAKLADLSNALDQANRAPKRAVPNNEARTPVPGRLSRYQEILDLLDRLTEEPRAEVKERLQKQRAENENIFERVRTKFNQYHEHQQNSCGSNGRSR